MRHEQAVRPRPRAQDLRYLRRVLAARPGGGRGQVFERRHQVRRVTEPSHAWVEQLGPDRGRRGRRHRGSQAGRGARAAGAWQWGPDPDAVAPQPHRPISFVDLPVLIGSGRRLFSEGTTPSGLKLLDSTVSTTGVVMGSYEPAGEIVTGSFAQD